MIDFAVRFGFLLLQRTEFGAEGVQFTFDVVGLIILHCGQVVKRFQLAGGFLVLVDRPTDSRGDFLARFRFGFRLAFPIEVVSERAEELALAPLRLFVAP